MIHRFFKIAGMALLAVLPSFRKTKSEPAASALAREQKKWKRWVRRSVLFFAALGAGGFLVAASGVLSIKASSRHWAMTRWILNFSKERSVATHSIGIKPPELDLEWRVLKGAGHFETGCRPCHGAPDVPSPRIPHAMTPNPPPLASELKDWDAAELFYIVKHGIKFTGMPAWPAKGRDDEVWDVVAFLQKLPTLDGKSYRELVHGNKKGSEGAPLQNLLPPVEIRDNITRNCARCHGTDGNGRGSGAFPKLAGQKPEYLFASLTAYRAGQRHSGIMEPIAAALSDSEMREIAEYYSGLATGTEDKVLELSSEAAVRGKMIAMNGIPSQRVPVCAACHGPEATRRNPVYPFLAGQYSEYLFLQLQLFSKHQRGGTEFHHLMHFAAGNLREEQMREVASFYASLAPERREQE